MRIVIIGTGNTATVLGKLFRHAEHQIIQVIGRSRERAELLAGMLDSPFSITIEEVKRGADIYIIAVSDHAIPEIARELRLDKKLVVHTAGSAGKSMIQNCSKNYGVLYPLQSLRKEMTRLPDVPFLIDGNTPDNATLIADFAKTASSFVELADDKKRLSVHAAAVIASNFTNYLYTISEDFCNKEHINFRILLPLIAEIAGRLGSYSPHEMQTGPAVRNDFITIEKHLLLLEPYPIQHAVYKFLTDSIQQWHSL